MSFWRKKKTQHAPASSLLDDPVSDQESSALQAPVIPSTTASEIDGSDQLIIDSEDGTSASPETYSSPLPVTSTPSTRRLSKYIPFRRNSSKNMESSSEVSPKSEAMNSPGIPVAKTPDSTDPRTLSPQPRPRNRTPSTSPYASPRTSIYGALSSPSTSSNPAEIFERSIESVPSVSTQSPSVKGLPTHQVLEDIIPPALEATAATFTDHVNPDNVEIVTFSEVQSTDSRSNAGSPTPSSPVLSAPAEATQNPWESDVTSSPDLDGKKRTLSLMSAVDHLADEIIHPAMPAPVEKKHAVSPLSLSPALSPADVPAVRTAMSDLSMERSPSQQSNIGDVMIMKHNMGDTLRQQKQYDGDTSPTGVEPLDGKKDELESNPWSQ